MADACCAPTERITSSGIGGTPPGCGRRGRPVGLDTVQSQEELADGYVFRFAAEAFPLVAAFVAHERHRR